MIPQDFTQLTADDSKLKEQHGIEELESHSDYVLVDYRRYEESEVHGEPLVSESAKLW